MKLSHNFFCLLLVVLVCLLAVFVETTEARRKGGKKGKNGGVCKYARKGEDGPCDAATNMKEVTLLLRRGDETTCAPTKVVSKPCDDNSMSKKKRVKGCKYERQGASWSECDEATGTKTKVMNVKEGSNPECPPTRTKSKNCRARKGSREGRRNKKVSDA